MSGIFRYKEKAPTNWFHQSRESSNQHCLYCCKFVGEDSNIESNKEHLIARDFVPRGSFGNGNQFNFIFRACKICNNKKSDIERHISSVTLFNSPIRKNSHTHNNLALRKAENDYHPDKKGILVKDSGDEFNISSSFDSINFSFGISGPPQVKPEYVKSLALRHIQGFFSLITSSKPLERDGMRVLKSEEFYLYGYYSYSDWGNPQLLEVMNRAKDIPIRVRIKTADGFFKVIMRRDEHGQWFWALEWNKSLRVIGALKHHNDLAGVFDNLPPLKWINLNGGETRVRVETPLNPELDILFHEEI